MFSRPRKLKFLLKNDLFQLQSEFVINAISGIKLINTAGLTVTEFW